MYNELGIGFQESVYKGAMAHALTQAGLSVQVELPIEVSFRTMVVGTFRADLVIHQAVLVELKAADQLTRQHESEILHYLHATPLEVGLLMNFGQQPRFKRFVLDNELKNKSISRSVRSVFIGGKPFPAQEIAR